MPSTHTAKSHQAFQTRWHTAGLPAPCKSGSPFVILRISLDPSSVPGSASFKTLCKPPTPCQSLHATQERAFRWHISATPLMGFLMFSRLLGKKWQRIGKKAAVAYSIPIQNHLKACKHARAFCIITHLYVLSFAISFISLVLNDIIQTSWARLFVLVPP